MSKMLLKINYYQVKIRLVTAKSKMLSFTRNQKSIAGNRTYVAYDHLFLYPYISRSREAFQTFNYINNKHCKHTCTNKENSKDRNANQK